MQVAEPRIQATRALMKIERIVATKGKQASSKDSEPIPSFLGPHMLGIITHLNDVLQNKQTVDTKRRAVRSLGAFVNQVGSIISNVAPQVRDIHSFCTFTDRF